MQQCEKCGMTIYTNNPERTICRLCEQELTVGNKYNLNGGEI